MHRSRRLKFTVIVTLSLLTIALAAPPPARADESYRVDSGEPTDPQSILDLIRGAGFDLLALGINVSTPLETLLNVLRTLGLIPPEESGS
jgi:hypothetical protein